MDRLKRIGVARLGLAWVLAWAWILAHWALYREPLTVAGVDLGWLLEGAPWMLGAALYFGAAAAFVLRRAQITTGLFLVVALGLLGEAERQVRGDVMPPLVTLLGATVILAWLAGRYLPGGSAEERAERGHELACGVLAAHLFLAALAKLALSGPGWVDGEVHALLIYERADGALLFLGDLRRAIAAHPALCGAGAAFALGVEALAPIYLWPRARLPYAILVLVMFAMMGVSLGLVEHGYEILPLAFTVGRLGPRETATP